MNNSALRDMYIQCSLDIYNQEVFHPENDKCGARLYFRNVSFLCLLLLVNYPDILQVFHEYLSIILFVLKPLNMSLLF